MSEDFRDTETNKIYNVSFSWGLLRERSLLLAREAVVEEPYLDPIDKPEKRWRLRKEPNADLPRSWKDLERKMHQGILMPVESDLRTQEERELKVYPFWTKPVGPILWMLLLHR